MSCGSMCRVTKPPLLVVVTPAKNWPNFGVPQPLAPPNPDCKWLLEGAQLKARRNQLVAVKWREQPSLAAVHLREERRIK
eukprot:5940396-Prymnesium_polylepis.1